MSKGLGIAAFVFLLISFPIPIVGNYITFLAILLVTGAALAGDKTWTIAVTVISAVKLFLLSPTWHLAMFGVGHQSFGPAAGLVNAEGAQLAPVNHGYLVGTLIMLALPISVLIGRNALAGGSASTPSDGVKPVDPS